MLKVYLLQTLKRYAESRRRLAPCEGCQKMEVRSWKSEDGSWKMEVGS